MRALALTMALTYAVLGGLASACTARAGVEPISHHGHAGKPLHMTLCMWACHSSCIETIPTPHQSLPLHLLLAGTLVGFLTLRAGKPIPFLLARGPPSFDLPR